MINSNQHIKIYDFMMAAGLRLGGICLLVYAYIYGFWASGKSMFASCGRMATLFGCTREHVNRSLMQLRKKGFIIRLSDKRGYDTFCYTINEEALDRLCDSTGCDLSSQEGCDISAQCDLSSQEGCDISAQGGETFPHKEVCGKDTARCAERSHNKKEIETNKEKIEDNCPLPLNCIDDEECRRLWGIITSSKKWASRSPEALAEAAKILGDKPVEVCRAMLSHTASGDYPKIYPPSQEMIVKAGCDKKSQPATITYNPIKEEDIDRLVFSSLQPYFPVDLKEKIYCGPNGKRALFFREHDGKVTITCPHEVRDWLETIPDQLRLILTTWIGPSYCGFMFGNNS